MGIAFPLHVTCSAVTCLYAQRNRVGRRADLRTCTAVPFLYEIRTLLDWTCISTSLDWYAWLKLEDIRASLFVAACRNRWTGAASLCIKCSDCSAVTDGPCCCCLLPTFAGDSSYEYIR